MSGPISAEGKICQKWLKETGMRGVWEPTLQPGACPGRAKSPVWEALGHQRQQALYHQTSQSCSCHMEEGKEVPNGVAYFPMLS